MIKKLKEKGLLSKKVLVPVYILIALGAITLISLSQAEKYDPIAEDGKLLMDGLKKEEETARKESQDVIGKEYPTKEEVERFEKTLSSEDVKAEKMESEFGEDVYHLYNEGLLVGQHEEPEIKAIKTGILSAENDDKGIKMQLNLLDGDTLDKKGDYMSNSVGFEKVGDIYVGYPTLSIKDWGDLERVRKDGYTAVNLTVKVYTMDKMTVKDLQTKVNTLKMELDGIEAKPLFERERKDKEKGLNILGKEVDLGSKEWKGVSSFGLMTDWSEFKFGEMVVYPGVVVDADFEIAVDDIFGDYDNDSDTFSKEHEQLNLGISEKVYEMKKVDGETVGIEFMR